MVKSASKKSEVKITHPTVDLKPVTSSNVDAMGYDPKIAKFFVRWKGKPDQISMYSGVTKACAAAVFKAESVGKAVRSLLIPEYAHEYVKAAPPAEKPTRRKK